MKHELFGQQIRKYPLPPVALMKEKFKYCPVTGDITGSDGRKIGWRDVHGYLVVSPKVDGHYVKVKAHRLAFALMTGRWPHLIDHIDGDKANNKWHNLREVSQKENARSGRGANGRNIYRRRKNKPSSRYVWRVQMRGEDRKMLTTDCTHFCQAWKIRDKWRKERWGIGGVPL